MTRFPPRELTRLRRDLQVIFQDPYSSLNPRMRVVDLVGEALEVHGLAKGPEVERVVADLLRRVGLSPSWINRYPHEFSGGQRQRIGVARAIALQPKLIVCDEAVSALDVSIQAQVINLLIELRREMNLSYLFIAHDLSVVRHVSHRIAVMYLGELVELGPSKRLFEAPAHPYTRALLSAIPVPVPGRQTRRLVLHGDVPTPLNPPSGCHFHTRCPAVMDRCRREEPPSVEVEPGHSAKCVHAEGLAGIGDWYDQMSGRIDRDRRQRGIRPTIFVVTRQRDGRPASRFRRHWRRPLDERRRESARTSRSLRRLGRRSAAPSIALGAVMILLGAWGSALRRGRGLPRARSSRRVAEKRRGDTSPSRSARSLCVLAGRRVTHARGRRGAPAARAPVGGNRAPAKPSPATCRRICPSSDGACIRCSREDRRSVGSPLALPSPGTEGRPFDLGSTGPDGVPSRTTSGTSRRETDRPGREGIR